MWYARRRDEHPAEARCGFTLIELLVVVSILALLVALLLPSLGRAKKAGNAVVCLSTLRQWGFTCMSYAQDSGGKLAPARTWGFYFYSAQGDGVTYRNLGSYYQSRHAVDKRQLFCPDAATGWINIDPAHHGFALKDHLPFWNGPTSIFTGPYRAGSYQVRCISPKYNYGLANDGNSDNWQHAANTPSYSFNDNLNLCLKVVTISSRTALVVDVFGLAAGYPGYGPLTVGHDYRYQVLFGDGSAAPVDCSREPFIFTNPHFGHDEFLYVFDKP